MAVHDPRIVERWRTIIGEWRTSGLGVAAFCRLRQIHKSGFHRWRSILEQLDTPRSQPRQQPASSAFVPVRVVADVVVEVILPCGVQLRVPLSADAQQLARLVLALGATPC
jgi:hypothetical protein